MTAMLTLAVDFDGTLVDESNDGSFLVLPGARETMEHFREAGYRIVIHTCRIGIAMEEGRLKQETAIIKQTLEHFAIPYDEIYMAPKMVADLYIDDRAIAFAGNWKTVEKLVDDNAAETQKQAVNS